MFLPPAPTGIRKIVGIISFDSFFVPQYRFFGVKSLRR